MLFSILGGDLYGIDCDSSYFCVCIYFICSNNSRLLASNFCYYNCNCYYYCSITVFFCLICSYSSLVLGYWSIYVFFCLICSNYSKICCCNLLSFSYKIVLFCSSFNNFYYSFYIFWSFCWIISLYLSYSALNRIFRF